MWLLRLANFLFTTTTELASITNPSIKSLSTSTFTPARPPAIPLAVKSPYLNTLLFAGSDGPDGGNGGYLAGEWPRFWAGAITGWTGLISVDGKPYTWMGAPSGFPNVTQTSFQYTSTKSIFSMEVGGKVSMNITFLSPVTPDDMKRQSLIFMYLDVEVASMDGSPHDVKLYSDVSAEWISGDRGTVAEWVYDTTTDGISYHKIYRQTQLLFSETNDQADWGYWYYTTTNTSTLSFQSGSDIIVRGTFNSTGKLGNTQDTKFRGINTNFPIFGFAVDLGDVVGSVSTVWTLGLMQEEAIQFDGANELVALPSLWTSYFQSEIEAVSFFYNDYANATSLCNILDTKISSDSIAAAGQNYSTITTLSTRQAFAATQLVGNSTTQYLFLKEISSDGNIQTVDVIFPFFPILLYLSPSLLKLLLDPLFENQESGQYPNSYSMHDLGSHYPNATAHADGKDEPMPLEECGNMIIMTLSYAQSTSDTAYLTQHYKILNQWTQYLIQESLIPATQISTDDFAGSLANQTNLALKGIIGISAMARIGLLTGNVADASNYTSISQTYISQWQTLAISSSTNPPHTTLAYGQSETHGLLYNLYADKLLNLSLVPQEVYDMQSSFYPTIISKYGVPLDTRHNYTKSDWQIWTASIASPSTRDLFISSLAEWINETPTNMVLTDLYDANTGDWPIGAGHFTARPVVGGHFALLALGGK